RSLILKLNDQGKESSLKGMFQAPSLHRADAGSERDVHLQKMSVPKSYQNGRNTKRNTGLHVIYMMINIVMCLNRSNIKIIFRISNIKHQQPVSKRNYINPHNPLLEANSSKGLLYIRFEHHIFKGCFEAVQNPCKKVLPNYWK